MGWRMVSRDEDGYVKTQGGASSNPWQQAMALPQVRGMPSPSALAQTPCPSMSTPKTAVEPLCVGPACWWNARVSAGSFTIHLWAPQNLAQKIAAAGRFGYITPYTAMDINSAPPKNETHQQTHGLVPGRGPWVMLQALSPTTQIKIRASTHTQIKPAQKN
ncbi:hypothetical protein FQR65_LT20646 [Abscondita terminalis]|nr:hypothetical protein FQR65_LT20646 [Abscondita terminalis]